MLTRIRINFNGQLVAYNVTRKDSNKTQNAGINIMAYSVTLLIGKVVKLPPKSLRQLPDFHSRSRGGLASTVRRQVMGFK